MCITKWLGDPPQYGGGRSRSTVVQVQRVVAP